MASGGSSRHPMSSDSRSFDFGSNELLFSYEDYTQQKDQPANAKKSDSTAKDLLENRVGRPLANLYGQQEVYPREDVISAVEICMKKHTDNLMRNLEDINGRLTQLELFCYKLERSVGEFRTDMIHGQSEADMKLKSLEKHIHEVQRSVQIIRDKQELADAHKELTKLHLSQKEAVNSNISHRNNEDVTAATSETKPQNDNKDISNLQLTLALPNQISSSHPIKPPDQNLPHKETPYIQNHASTYYSHHQPPPQEQHIQHLQQRPQIQNLSQYQHQWPQPSSQSQVPPTYPPYTPYQPAITESFQSRSIGYGATGSSISHPPPQQNTPQQNMQWPPPPPPPSSHIRANPPPHPTNMQAYNPAYAIDGSRASHPESYQTNINMPSLRNHPYGEIIESAVNMGYSRDHVVNVVKLMGETGQPLDFNALLDELNMHANGGTPRAWSR